MWCKVYNSLDFQNRKESPAAYLEAECRHLQATFLSCLQMSYSPTRDPIASSAGMGLLDGRTPMSAIGYGGSLREYLSWVIFVESYLGVKRQETFCVFSLHGLLASITSADTALYGVPPDLLLHFLLFISTMSNVTMTPTSRENKWWIFYNLACFKTLSRWKSEFFGVVKHPALSEEPALPFETTLTSFSQTDVTFPPFEDSYLIPLHDCMTQSFTPCYSILHSYLPLLH